MQEYRAQVAGWIADTGRTAAATAEPSRLRGVLSVLHQEVARTEAP